MADIKAIAEELVNLTVKEVNELATIQMCIRDRPSAASSITDGRE